MRARSIGAYPSSNTFKADPVKTQGEQFRHSISRPSPAGLAGLDNSVPQIGQAFINIRSRST
jgi:hypothetical protein